MHFVVESRKMDWKRVVWVGFGIRLRRRVLGRRRQLGISTFAQKRGSGGVIIGCRSAPERLIRTQLGRAGQQEVGAGRESTEGLARPNSGIGDAGNSLVEGGGGESAETTRLLRAGRGAAEMVDATAGAGRRRGRDRGGAGVGVGEGGGLGAERGWRR